MQPWKGGLPERSEKLSINYKVTSYYVNATLETWKPERSEKLTTCISHTADARTERETN